MNRTFGIEIEAYGIDKHELARTLRMDEGIQAVVEGYNHQTRDHWKIVTDSSIQGENSFEIVSPVLSGEAGIAEAETVCNVITAMGGQVNSSCGFHVHVGANDIGLKGIKNVAKAWIKNEWVADTFMPKSRRDNNGYYCRSNAIGDETEQMKAIDNAETVDDVIMRMGNGRFHKMNLTALWRHQTIEFRHHSGTTEAAKVVNWIRFCVAFVETASKKNSRARKNGRETLRYATAHLLNMLQTAIPTEEIKAFRAFYRNRQKHFVTA
jgi:hypothetical protein